MSSSICTLFEGNYHFGVAALTNSLQSSGFKGSVYVGYRGVLPFWCSSAVNNPALEWQGAKSLIVSSEISVHFLLLETNYHFTNYKPDFMLRLIETLAKKDRFLFYFDPDIVITASWSCFKEWADCGVALSEDVNSPLSEYHPRRMGWRKFFTPKGFELNFKEAAYVNGGFVGIKIEENQDFLKIWQILQEVMAPSIGGLNRSSLIGLGIPEEARGPFSPFGKTDQDALNATIEVWKGKVSIVGKEAMGFSSGLALMPHALGHPKPWRWKPLVRSFYGQPPRLVDREYWKIANACIKTHSSSLVSYRRLCISLAAFIGRFYKRGSNGGIY